LAGLTGPPGQEAGPHWPAARRPGPGEDDIEQQLRRPGHPGAVLLCVQRQRLEGPEPRRGGGHVVGVETPPLVNGSHSAYRIYLSNHLQIEVSWLSLKEARRALSLKANDY